MGYRTIDFFCWKNRPTEILCCLRTPPNTQKISEIWRNHERNRFLTLQYSTVGFLLNLNYESLQQSMMHDNIFSSSSSPTNTLYNVYDVCCCSDYETKSIVYNNIGIQLLILDFFWRSMCVLLFRLWDKKYNI